jgi:hypothetical protein
MITLRKPSPFKLTTHFRGWSRVLAIALGLSLLLNFALIYANVRQSANLATPRIVVKTPSGIVLPLAASAFVWTPDVAKDYIRLFLPVAFTFSPAAASASDTWSPFIHPQILKAATERFQKNQPRIQSDGLNQTLQVRQVDYDPDTETATVIAEVRLIDRNGQVTRSSLNLTVELSTTADPLNPYGHAIINIR